MHINTFYSLPMMKTKSHSTATYIITNYSLTAASRSKAITTKLWDSPTCFHQRLLENLMSGVLIEKITYIIKLRFIHIVTTNVIS